MTSSRAARASSRVISGRGLASAMTSGRAAMERIISCVSRPGLDTPRKTSAPTIASASVDLSVSTANSAFSGVSPVRERLMTPLLSHSVIFSRRAPTCTNIRAVAIAAAPAPLTTMRTSSILFPVRKQLLISAAELIMAVPCWSSCMTGMSSSSRKRRSISKHSGALMSSRFIPPNVGAMRFTVSTNSSTSSVSISMSKAFMPAICLNSIHLPSITGLAAFAPMLPRPSTAVPLEMTATRLPLPV